MYERLPLDYIGVTDKFGYVPSGNGTQRFHYGVDLGWHNYQGEPVYAIYDSKVVYEAYDVNLGNYVVLSYEKNDKTIIYRFLHFKDRAIVKAGDTVKRGQIVGYMGTTGDSTGVHLHFEYWICPKNYTYYYGDRPTYAVNPLDYCYLFEDQNVSSDDAKSVIRIIGMGLKAEKNDNINQIEVVGEQLRCRENYGLTSNILGYIDYGIYNIIEKAYKDNYTWYKIGDNKWIAGVETDVKVYLKDDEENTSPSTTESYDSFTATKSDYYYIYLKEQETIYFPK